MANLYVILLPQMDEHRNLGYMIKIGYSKSLKESRMKYGYSQYHRTVEVLHLYEGEFTLEDETKLKQYFKDHILFRREYLEYCPEVLDFFNTYNTSEKLINVLSTLSVTKRSYTVCPWIVDYIIHTYYKNLKNIEKQRKRDEIINNLRYFNQEKQLINACSIYNIERKEIEKYIESKTNLEIINNITKNLVQEFFDLGSTEAKLHFIVSLENKNLTNKELNSFFSLIPDKYKEYYDDLGFEGIRAHRYNEAEIKREQEKLCGNSQKEENLKNEIYRLFIIGNRYVKADIKNTLKSLYERIGYQKTAKATDLEEYYVIKPILTSDKKHGFEILSKK